MNRRFGVESIYGIGGGIVSKEQQKNLDKAEDLCRKRKPKQALPYLCAAIAENPDNLDAAIQFAFLNDRKGALEVLEGAELKGQAILKKRLGEDCFKDSGDCVGHFWGLIETRPYMRVLQALVRVYFEDEQYEKSANTIIEILRLCPGDNLGQRDWLGSLLVRIGRYADALSFAQIWLAASERGDIPPRGGTAFPPPSQGLLPPERAKSLASWGPGALLHTAAIASFKLFGDCAQSREHLALAAKAQPNVLLKVLALVARPANLNMDARSINGPEEAQDYLWLTQDLWMASEVWKWANESPDVLEAVLRTCDGGGCGKKEKKVAEFKRCSACHLVRYCSPTCQKEDWTKHKPACQEHKYLKTLRRSMVTGKPGKKPTS